MRGAHIKELLGGDQRSGTHVQDFARPDLVQSPNENQVPPPQPEPDYVSNSAPHVLHFDVEGRNRINIKVCGGDLWARTATILCLAYAVDDGPVKLWWPGD